MVNSDVEELAKMSPHGSPSQVDDDAIDDVDDDGNEDGQEQYKSALKVTLQGTQECSIEMLEQPEEKFRFRYKSEMQVYFYQSGLLDKWISILL